MDCTVADYSLTDILIAHSSRWSWKHAQTPEPTVWHCSMCQLLYYWCSAVRSILFYSVDLNLMSVVVASIS